jgi:hypothetical protein
MALKRIFISYRRSDASGHAGRLYDYLRDYFGPERIFFDVDTIQAGTNFEQRITTELDNSDAALVIIGNQWLDAKDKEGTRRLDNPQDYVRFEVETALRKNIPVIPILVQGVQMPSANMLPETLYDLSRRNAIRLNDDHWASDCDLLAGTLKNALHVFKSLKEQKIRNYRFVVFALSALVTLLAVLSRVEPTLARADTLSGLAVSLLTALLGVVNVALVTYLLGNIKKELDRLSWAIISFAITGGLTASLGSFLTIWSAMMMILVAGLLNFVEPDE